MSEVLPRARSVPKVVPPLLAFAAGFVDSCTFLALFGLFVAQVTGSFVLAAVAFVTSERGVAIKVLGIPTFLLAAMATTTLAIMVERRGRSAIAWTLGLECVALTGFLAAVVFAVALDNPDAVEVVVASLLGLFAMGTQSAAVRLLMSRMASTNVMTTNTTQIAIDATELLFAWHARRRAPHDAAVDGAYRDTRARCVALFPIMLGFLAGSGAGAAAYVLAGPWGLLLPLAIMYGIFVWACAEASGWR